jgi:hypothetical protein
MPEYRIFTIAAGERILTPPEVVDCDDDHEAIARAQQKFDGQVIEVWHMARRVVRLEPRSE